MDRESFLMEHGSDYLFEPKDGVVGRCEHCGEDINIGCSYYRCDDILLHKECALDYILSNFEKSCIVKAMGFAIGG